MLNIMTSTHTQSVHKITTKTRSKPRWVSTQGTKNKNKSKRKKNSYFFMISSHAKSETNQNAARIGRGRE